MARLRDWLSTAWKAVKPGSSRPPSRTPYDYFPATYGDTLPRGASDILGGYANLPWLRAITGRIAQSLAATEWQLYATRQPGQRATRNAAVQRASGAVRRKAIGDLVEQGRADRLENHVLLDLLHNGNPHHTGVQLWRLTSASVDLVGEAFWLLQRSILGVPVALWPIPPTWVLETPAPGRDTYRINFKGRYAEVAATEILPIVDPNPADPYGRGTGIAGALADELATDEYASKIVRQFFIEGARPDFMTWPKDGTSGMGLDEAERKRFEQDWLNRHQGFARAFRPYLAGQEMGVHEFEKDFSKMQMTELRQFERDTMMQTYGMPPEMMGLLENSNRATIESAEYIFARWLVVPRLEIYRSIMQERLVPLFDERLVLDYASPIPSDKARELQAAQAQPHVLKVNEWRGLAGKEPTPDGDVYMVPPNLMPIASFDEEPPPIVSEPPAPAAPAVEAPVPANQSTR